MKKYLFLTMAMLLVLSAPSDAADKPDVAARKRAHSFTQRLIDGKYDDAMKFVDPDLIADDEARKMARNLLRDAVGFVKGANALVGRKITSFTIPKVILSEDKTSATVQVRYYTANARTGANREQHESEQAWVLKNKEWYFQK